MWQCVYASHVSPHLSATHLSCTFFPRFILRESGFPRYLHSAVLLSGTLLIFGGNTHNDTSLSNGAKCFSADFLAYDIGKKLRDIIIYSIYRFDEAIFPSYSFLCSKPVTFLLFCVWFSGVVYNIFSCLQYVWTHSFFSLWWVETSAKARLAQGYEPLWSFCCGQQRVSKTPWISNLNKYSTVLVWRVH